MTAKRSKPVPPGPRVRNVGLRRVRVADLADAPCGVYVIRHLISGKVYVGSSANMKIRWATHVKKLRAGTHYNRHLQAAWSKDGESAFEFVVVELVGDVATMTEREQRWIDQLKAASLGYNLRAVAQGNRGGTLSDEHKRKLRLARKGKTPTLGWHPSEETREKMRARQLGRKWKWRSNASDEFREKCRQRMLGKRYRLGHSPSAETREKLSRAMNGKRNALGVVPSLETRQKISAAVKRARAARSIT